MIPKPIISKCDTQKINVVYDYARACILAALPAGDVVLVSPLKDQCMGARMKLERLGVQTGWGSWYGNGRLRYVKLSNHLTLGFRNVPGNTTKDTTRGTPFHICLSEYGDIELRSDSLTHPITLLYGSTMEPSRGPKCVEDQLNTKGIDTAWGVWEPFTGRFLRFRAGSKIPTETARPKANKRKEAGFRIFVSSIGSLSVAAVKPENGRSLCYIISSDKNACTNVKRRLESINYDTSWGQWNDKGILIGINQ